MAGWTLPKGKYKGYTVEEVAKIDHRYLQWILDNWDLDPYESGAVQEALNPSRERFKQPVGIKYITELEVYKATEFLLRKTNTVRLNGTADDAELAERSLKEMYRMLTGKDYVAAITF